MVIKLRNSAASTTEGKINSTGEANRSESPWQGLKKAYVAKTAPLTKILDCYLLSCFLGGLVQLICFFVIKQIRYEHFFGGFMACVGSFVMAANVRLQMDTITGRIGRKPLIEFIFGTIALHLIIAKFINSS